MKLKKFSSTNNLYFILFSRVVLSPRYSIKKEEQSIKLKSINFLQN
jgi:hypothetical protein